MANGINVTVECSCGVVLDSELRLNDLDERMELKVKPCPSCTKDQYDDGHTEGYNEGHDAGYDKGKEEGIAEGKAEAEKERTNG